LQGGSPARIDHPQLLPASGDGWRALSAGNAHAMAIAANGAVYTWGNGLRGALGNGVDNGSVLAPNLVTVP
jgi:alpha-tubulin suppressor-like RCC1 family protein